MKNYTPNGWVRLHRKIENNFLYFLEPFTKAQAWIDLFLNANHTDGQIGIRGNIVPIKRGQIGWSELTMASRWGWSRDKVRRFLSLLETRQQIIQQKQYKLTTVITILKYEEYQSDTTDDTTERQQKDNRQYTNKNEKKDKNDKNEKKLTTGEGREFLNKWNDTFSSNLTSTASIEDNLSFWLKEYSLEQIFNAIERIKDHEYWKDKMRPDTLLRRKNPRGDAVDYIGEMLSLKKREEYQGYA